MATVESDELIPIISSWEEGVARFLFFLISLFVLSSVSLSHAPHASLYSVSSQISDHKEPSFVPASSLLPYALILLSCTAVFLFTPPVLELRNIEFLLRPSLAEKIHLFVSSGLSPPTFS